MFKAGDIVHFQKEGIVIQVTKDQTSHHYFTGLATEESRPAWRGRTSTTWNACMFSLRCIDTEEQLSALLEKL